MNITTSPRLEASLKSNTEKHMNILSSQRIIPQAMELQSFRIEYKSILIETSSVVFVIGHDDGYSSVGSTTHIPLHKLSTKYIVKTMMPMPDSTSQLALSAIKDNYTAISNTCRMNQNCLCILTGRHFTMVMCLSFLLISLKLTRLRIQRIYIINRNIYRVIG